MTGKILGLRSLIYGKFETESAFAESLGWPRQRLSRITNGKKVPDIYEAKAMADALGVDIDTFAKFFFPPYKDAGQVSLDASQTQ